MRITIGKVRVKYSKNNLKLKLKPNPIFENRYVSTRAEIGYR